jgi:DNA-directed RNA polymerase subunit M/transcription elongation factor TFIIS
MRFCNQCRNMLYMRIKEESSALTYYCRMCGKEDNTETAAICALQSSFVKGENHYAHIINPFTKLDPTLPRIYSMKCPNADCTTNHSEATAVPEIIYIRYDDENMKFVYICVTCDHVW